MQTLIDFILHIDTHLLELAARYGAWLYGILFAIVFAETGLVVTPFLPGDSLLFAAGALAATPGPTGAPILRVELVIGLLLVAAILGDAVNYAIGHYIGPRVFTASDDSGLLHKLLNRRPPGAGARVLRALRRQGRGARPLRADRADVRAVRGRRRRDDLLDVRRSTTSSARSSGSACASALGYVFGNVPIVQARTSRW